MVLCYQFQYFFRRTLPFLILVGGISERGEIKMASANTPPANKPTKDLIIVHIVQLKPMIKAQISGRMVGSGISDVSFASVYSEKTHLKQLIMIIFIMKKSQEMTVFKGCQKLTSAMNQRLEKWW